MIKLNWKVLSEFICPSNETGVAHVLSNSYARGNYVANNGIGPMRESTNADLPLKRDGGMFYLNSKTTLKKSPDGSSKTALVCEVRVVKGEDWRGIMHFPEGPLYQHNNPPNSSTSDHLRNSGCLSTLETPCYGAFAKWNDRALTMTARSSHSGGVNLLLGDGRVEFVADKIDANVWRTLATTNVVADEPYVHLPAH